MKQRNWMSYLTLEAPHRGLVLFLMTIISALYLFNFHVNDIWTPNESFYAEAVREMFESGNFMEFFYNYEPRYKKPPLTYWAIAGSVSVFGMTEFAIRLPIVLMAIGSVWFSYLLGRVMYGEKGGVYAMIMMAVSLQLLSVKQYASPETPLTLFFTAAMYYFIKAYKDRNNKSLYLSYLMLALAVLAKGFPYLIVAAAIIGLFVLLNNWLDWKAIFKDIRFLKLHIGLPMVVIIGLGWIIYMYLKDGNAFWEVYYRETFGRALSKETRGPQPFFYLEVISWSIVPYSLAFFFALIKWIRDRKDFKKVLFPFCWFIAMLVIFTISKGKLPTYIIQAHPAMLLMVVPLLLDYKPTSAGWKGLWAFVFLFPAVLILGATIYMVWMLELHWAFYLAPAFGIAMMGHVYYYKTERNHSLTILPFYIMAGFLVCFSAYSPRLENYRPYDEIGQTLDQQSQIAPSTPLMIEGTLIHNMPFYAKRKVEGYLSIEQIQQQKGPKLAMVKNSILDQFPDYDPVWTGLIYDFSSESQFFKFMMAVVNAEKGDLSKFAEYSVIYKP